MKRILSLICVGVMVFVGGVVMAGCGGYDFENNQVQVQITSEAASSKEYTIEDFDDIGCLEISFTLDSPEDGSKWYWLMLNQKSHKNVLKAVKILEAREDIAFASPVYLGNPIPS